MHIFLVSLLGLISILHSKTSAEQAQQYADEAQQLFAEAKYGEGIILLEKAHQLDSLNSMYQCEIANGYINVRDYATAERILKDLQYRKSANDRVFQLLGRLYSVQSETEKAEEYLQKGLRFFQNSGRLYLELGVLKYYQQAVADAVSLWIKGTLLDPEFSSNYYWLTKYFAETDVRLWAVIYGELFLCLEQDSFRSMEVSALIFNLYKKAYEYSDKNPEGAEFLAYLPSSDELSIPFTKRFILTMQMARKVTDLGNNTLSEFYGISDIRFDFVEYWFEQRLNEIYPFAQFDFLNELYSLGFWDSYHAWLLLRWSETDFKFWLKEHEADYDNFLVWFNGERKLPDSNSEVFGELKEKYPIE